TGDNHIGMKYASHEKSDILCKARLTAFENMVKAANENECGLFVITGDLFENTYAITKRDISALTEMLSGFKGTVVILPGNHDYYDPDSKLWRDFKSAGEKCDNIMILNRYRPYNITVNDEEAVLYPAFCKSLHSEPGENNLGWIKDENIVPDEKYRIGIAHGAVEGETIDSEGRYFLMSRKELEEIPVDAWLIGHTHVPFPDNLSEDRFMSGEKIFNCGTHVQTDVSCNTSGLCFIIEIEKDGDKSVVKAKKYCSGNLNFYRMNISLTAGHAQEILERELKALPDNSVVDLIISGAVTSDEYENRAEIYDKHLSRFIESNYNDSKLSRLISKELIDAEFPETSFSAGFLSALLDEPKQAQLAYEMLKGLKEQNK
ncbi:MAG: exonuclease SbcCD subunit D, partial [Acutalibacteraceae bacterium]